MNHIAGFARWGAWLLVIACTEGDAPDTTSDSVPPPMETEELPEPPPDVWAEVRQAPFPVGPVLVIPEDRGVGMTDVQGTPVWFRRWSALVGDCFTCGGEGASPDGDGLLLSFTTSIASGDSFLPPGDVARIDGNGELDFRVSGFGFPHDVIRDPADDTLFVVETFGDRVTWIDGAGTSNVPLRAIQFRSGLRGTDLPNGADRFEFDGRSLLLLSKRGKGTISLWDISVPQQEFQVWEFPPDDEDASRASPRLGAPHGPVFREVDGRWWLLYAHTYGAPGRAGTVGVAVTDDPTVMPEYVVDLLPDDDVGRFGFLRGVELFDGELWLTDSGALSGSIGRLVQAWWPDELPEPDGSTGRKGDQRFRPLGPAEVRLPHLYHPFEGWRWEGPTDPEAQP